MLTLRSTQPVEVSRVVVMGAGGFVGRATVRQLRAAEIPVVELTRTHVDLLATEAAPTLAGWLRPDDTLVVTAAIAPAKTSAMLLANVQMMQAVVTALQKTPVRHLIYVSSDAVYKDSAMPLTEASCAQPDSIHGAMHVTREIMLRHSLPQIPLAVVRPTLIYGAGDPHNGYGPNRFLRLALKGEPIALAGQGEERRDHIHIDDVASVIVRCIRHAATGTLNAVSGSVISFREVAELAVKLSGSASPITFSARSGPMPHNGYRAFDPALLTRSFPGFRTQSLSEGIQRTLTATPALLPLESS